MCYIIRMDYVKNIYRTIHENPELGFSEHQTAALIQDELRKNHIDFNVVEGTGVVGLIDKGAKKTVLLRADMDALPIQEKTNLSYSSKNENMHACGHDAHVAMLLGASANFVNNKDLESNVKLVFQPGEEGHSGGARIVRTGVMENPTVNAAHAIHVWPEFETGTVGLKSGVLGVVVGHFNGKVKTSGGHVAETEPAMNPVHIVIDIASRIKSLNDPKKNRVQVSQIQSGNPKQCNILDQICTVSGDVRAFSVEDLENTMEQILGIFADYGKGKSIETFCEYKIYRDYPPVINDPKLHNFVRSLAVKSLKVHDIKKPYLIGEDFSNYTKNNSPLYMSLLGCSSRSKVGNNALHTPTFTVDENALEHGVRLHQDFVVNYR